CLPPDEATQFHLPWRGQAGRCRQAREWKFYFRYRQHLLDKPRSGKNPHPRNRCRSGLLNSWLPRMAVFARARQSRHGQARLAMRLCQETHFPEATQAMLQADPDLGTSVQLAVYYSFFISFQISIDINTFAEAAVRNLMLEPGKCYPASHTRQCRHEIRAMRFSPVCAPHQSKCRQATISIACNPRVTSPPVRKKYNLTPSGIHCHGASIF